MVSLWFKILHKLHSQGLLSVAFIDDGYLLRQIAVDCTGTNVGKNIGNIFKIGFCYYMMKKSLVNCCQKVPLNFLKFQLKEPLMFRVWVQIYLKLAHARLTYCLCHKSEEEEESNVV